MSLAANSLTFDITQFCAGDAPSLRCPILEVDGTAANLTDRVVKFQVFRNMDDAEADAIIAKTSENDEELDISTPASAGIIFVHFLAVDAALLSPQQLFFYRTIIVELDGRQGLVNSGFLLIKP